MMVWPQTFFIDSVSTDTRMLKSSQCTSVAFDLEGRWQDKFYQLRNPHMNYCNNSSLHTAESQAADKIQSRFKLSKRPVNVHFFSLTILLAKSALLV